MKKRRNKKEYPRKRKEYREWCREQKHEKEEKIRNIKRETEAWKYINKCRKKKTERISENINIDKWKDHFAEPLGTQEKAVWQMESEEEDNTEEREKIEDITREKLTEMLKKLKKAKAPRQNRE